MKMATAQSEPADYERDLDLTARLICVTGGVPMGGATREKLISVTRTWVWFAMLERAFKWVGILWNRSRQY